MPKLRRMRLVSIGHADSRYSDVTLKFLNRNGDPTNSVLWLANGGGKSQLLGLFFAGIRPNKREFLGQRAEEKVRSIDECVDKRDHGLVICEWELDADNSLFNERPTFLTGVFYEWPSSQADDGKSGVDRLFFTATSSPDVEEMSLDGLPIYNQGKNEVHRFHLKGFQRQLRRIDRAHPELEVFETKAQKEFMTELHSHGIDPEVFRYQITMNEREGGASELFSFSQDAEFVDFILEMAFSQQKAKDVREQLTTFREELVVRNEQLKPEKKYCEGLMTRLSKLVNIHRDRQVVLADTNGSLHRLLGLKSWVASRSTSLESEIKNLVQDLTESRSACDKLKGKADELARLAAVNQRHACQIRFDEIDAELQQAKIAYAEATKLKNVWSAARPLSRCWEFRRQAKMNREQLARKQQQFAPDLARLKETATSLANAIAFEAEQAKGEEVAERDAVKALEEAAKEFQTQAQSEGEIAAKNEAAANQLENQLDAALAELQLLQKEGVLIENESADDGQSRINDQIRLETEEMNSSKSKLISINNDLEDLSSRLKTAEATEIREQGHLKALELEQAKADSARSKIENDAALLRLLQADRVDIESASVKAVDAASDELRRITEAILRIKVESAEDERAVDWLQGDGELLPPSRDVQTTLNWLGRSGVAAWAGWEYISRNVAKSERRSVVERMPFVASGIVVSSKDYDRIVELSGVDADSLQLRSAITIVPTEILSDTNEITWTVVGPASDAHFDKEVAAKELNRLEARCQERQTEINDHASWQHELVELRQELKSFQESFPRGWFANNRQKIEVAKAKLAEAQADVKRIADEQVDLTSKQKQFEELLSRLRDSTNENQRRLDRVEGYLRQFGKNLIKWRRSLEQAQLEYQKRRDSQNRLLEKVESNLQSANDHKERVIASRILAKQLEGEISRLKYVDKSRHKPSIGSTQTLRTDYDSLLLEYQEKVNTETLEQLAVANDAEANKYWTEFERVLAQFSDIGETEVEKELKKLPEHQTAAIRWEQAEKDEKIARSHSGHVGFQARLRREELEPVNDRCNELLQSGPLPEVESGKSDKEYQMRADQLSEQELEHRALCEEFEKEIVKLESKLTANQRELEDLSKDAQFLDSMEINHQELFDRLRRYSPNERVETSVETATIKDAGDLSRQRQDVEIQLRVQKTRHAELDYARDTQSNQIASWSRQKIFSDFAQSICHRFVDKQPETLESKSEFYITQLEHRVLEIERKLEEADKHHDRVVGILAAAVDEALSLLNRVSRMSKLPDTLPQAGKHFIKIKTKASDNPAERRAKIADLIAEIVQTGDVGDGLELIQKGVRQVAVSTKVGILHPDLRSSHRLNVAELKRKSGGERLTCAIMLYCALVKLRQFGGDSKQSNVLLLDNPIGTASRVSFLDLQREVAESMNVQLIYATGVNDLNAVSALENVIRLRNCRVDKRTNRKMVELDGDGEWTGQIDTARVVFDKPAGSTVGMEESMKARSETGGHGTEN